MATYREPVGSRGQQTGYRSRERMLRIIASNRQEALLDQLAERLRTPADANPRGGVRWVIPGKAKHWVDD